MDTFTTSVYGLLQQHPLYTFRNHIKGTLYELHVVLIGSGEYLDSILDIIIPMGQLLNTKFFISILSKNPIEEKAHLLERAPLLDTYAKIHLENENIEREQSYVDCTFLEDSQDNLQSLSHCKYVFISTGMDRRNEELARLCSFIYKDSLISFVQKKKIRTMDTASFSVSGDIEKIGFNIHYVYTKEQESKASLSSMEEEFKKPYNYNSSIEAALHIKSKLASCGIDSNDLKKDADAFYELMLEDKKIITKLAGLEHKRWMLEKILKGYVQVENLNKIYSAPGIRTHDATHKWHTCLVPYGSGGQLLVGSLDIVDENALKKFGPLDQMSIRIHQKCKEIAEKNRSSIENTLNTIHRIILKNYNFDVYLIALEEQVRKSIEHLWMHKSNGIFLYKNAMESFKKELNKKSFHYLVYMKSSIEELETLMEPLLEYVSDKDYKVLDRYLIEKIPFILTHEKESHVLFTVGGSVNNLGISLWRLEPSKAILVQMAGEALVSQIKNMSRVVCDAYKDIQIKHYVFVKQSSLDYFKDMLKEEGDNVIVRKIASYDLSVLKEEMEKIAQEEKIDAICNCDGDTRMILAAAQLNLPILSNEKGKLKNVVNYPQANYQHPRKNMSVKEMFDLLGTELIEDPDSLKLADLSTKYKALWDVSQNKNWKNFCDYIIANRDTCFVKYKVRLTDPKGGWNKDSFTCKNELLPVLEPLFKELEEEGYIQKVHIPESVDFYRKIEFLSKTVSGKKLSEIIKTCVGYYRPGMKYAINRAKKETNIVCSTICVENLSMDDQHKSLLPIFEKMHENGLIMDYKMDANKKISFRFISQDVLDSIFVSGKILEFYLYYSILLESSMKDIEMGWHFKHSGKEDSIDNELDIICTKGFSSYFISAKNVSKPKELNYYLYEISLMADRFGINATPILAMPQIPMFEQIEGQWILTSTFRRAQRRGVALLGKECFQRHQIGAIMDQIARGKQDWYKILLPNKK